MLPITLVLLALLVAACETQGGNASATDRGVWGPGQAWRIVEEARIGGADGAASGTFGSVLDVALDPMGRAWIADAQQKQLLVFDTRGKHVRTIGAQGGGPREFAAIAGMDFAPDGKLWVLDSGNARFAVYDTAGKLVRTQPRLSMIAMAPWSGGFDSAGRLYDLGMRATDGRPPAMVILRSEPSQLPDTFPLPEFKGEYFEVRGGTASNRTVVRLLVPFSGVQTWALDPDGYVWIANTAEYRIERHRFSGGVDRVVEREVERVPVTREDRARLMDETEFFTRQGGKIDLSRIPDHQPALSGFVFDETGHLWVSPVLEAAEGGALDVFAPSGSYLGRVPLPGGRISVRAIRGNQVAGVAKDSLGVESVILMRIVKPAG